MVRVNNRILIKTNCRLYLATAYLQILLVYNPNFEEAKYTLIYLPEELLHDIFFMRFPAYLSLKNNLQTTQSLSFLAKEQQLHCFLLQGIK